MKPSVNLILYTAKKKKKGGYPVKVRVIYQRTYHDYRTEFSLTEDEFNEALQPAPRKAYRDLNKKLLEEKARAIKIAEHINPFDFEKFKSEFHGITKDASDVYSIFDAYINMLKSQGRQKTATSYESAKNSFMAYKAELSLYGINQTFLENYMDEMVKKGKSNATIGIYLRCLRAIYNYAVNEGLFKRDENYPFIKNKFTIPASKNTKKALSEAQISTLFKYDAIPGTKEDWARDMWILSYLCSGINFKDIALLKVKNIDGDMLRFVREKTKLSTIGNQSQISCAITDKVREIINKWGNPDGAKDDYIFNIVDKEDDPKKQMRKIDQFIKQTNKYVKQIAVKVNMGIIPTTYHARHSFTTTLIRSGVQIEVVQEQLGHTSLKTTKSYFAGFGDDVKKDIAAKLTDFL